MGNENQGMRVMTTVMAVQASPQELPNGAYLEMRQGDITVLRRLLRRRLDVI